MKQPPAAAEWQAATEAIASHILAALPDGWMLDKLTERSAVILHQSGRVRFDLKGFAVPYIDYGYTLEAVVVWCGGTCVGWRNVVLGSRYHFSIPPEVVADDAAAALPLMRQRWRELEARQAERKQQAAERKQQAAERKREIARRIADGTMPTKQVKKWRKDGLGHPWEIVTETVYDYSHLSSKETKK